jgi:hypothetical protein
MVVRIGTSTDQEDRMSVSRPAIGALAALGIGLIGGSALAQWQNSPLMRSFADNWSSSSQNVVGQLTSNEGIYVDTKDFKIAKGMAKGDPAAQITKLGARKVSDGAIIFRSGDDLYIVDSKLPANTQ